MANKNPTNNSQNLLLFTQNKSKIAFEKVENAIKQSIKEQKLINFNAVSEVADVSKHYLYNNQELRERINNLD